MKILWHSNAPWTPTGYGNQTDTFIWRLRDALKHEITVSCFYGLDGAPMVINGMTMLPKGRDAYGLDTLQANTEYIGADVVITLMDVWVFPAQVTSNVRWCPWFPIDHDPAPPGVLQALQSAFMPIAYSKFGLRKLEEAGMKALYVPHGIDTNTYKPIDQKVAREAMGAPKDVFLVGIVAANKGVPSRKAFDQQIRALAAFHKKHPDSMLYLHTDMMGLIGEDLGSIIVDAGLPPTAVATPPVYRYAMGMLGKDYMAHLYSSFDVLMNCSRGEGFGVPIVEAQACGVPVIVGDYTSMPELVFAGWTVGYSDKFRSQESYQFVPSVNEMVDALELAYEMKGNQAMRAQARTGALEYDADRVTQVYWKPALETIAAKLNAGRERLKPVVIESKAPMSEQAAAD